MAFDGFPARGSHIRRSLKGPFSLAQDNPLPRGAKRETDFSREFHLREISPFWYRRLGIIRFLIEYMDHQQEAMGVANLPDVRPSADGVETVGLLQMARKFGIGVSS